MSLATILVEDSSTIRESLIPAMAEFANVEVIEAVDTAADGIRALREHSGRWRLAVIDIFLKQGNGLEVLRSVKRRDSRQHVVVLTNYATPDIRERAIAAGANAVFDKSTELEQFLELCATYAAQEG